MINLILIKPLLNIFVNSVKAVKIHKHCKVNIMTIVKIMTKKQIILVLEEVFLENLQIYPIPMGIILIVKYLKMTIFLHLNHLKMTKIIKIK